MASRGWEHVTIEDTTPRRGVVQAKSEEYAADVLELLVPRQLKSPNAWNGRHWRYKHRESQAWEMDIAVELLVPRAKQSAWALLYAMNAISPKRVCLVPMRVDVVRLVPSKRNFIRDEDNLNFAVKPLNDALKRLGLIRDDSRKWLEQSTPTQELSPTGGWATRIRIGAAR